VHLTQCQDSFCESINICINKKSNRVVCVFVSVQRNVGRYDGSSDRMNVGKIRNHFNFKYRRGHDECFLVPQRVYSSHG
jgi:hypothetical protein